MNRHFIFCHGFGFDVSFWDNLSPYFAREKCTFIDLGYFKKPLYPKIFHEQKVIGIGHSLGLLKLVELHKNFEYIIILNGFRNFLGFNPILRKKREVELEILERKFMINPLDALNIFYRKCGISSFTKGFRKEDLNFNLMQSELNLLRNIIILPSIPILVLSSNDDMIVPPQIVKDNFSNFNAKLEIINHGGHILGLAEPLFVYEKIMKFLDDSSIK
ncbi:hypothetical protein [Candidatus Fokinia crypta]|uniref:BioH-like alpha-beta hydrolase family protein n=1 Tax=Candidatus Fokinia crypta TaxID=1920990 RepID=A0ABZ0UP37_9RICK|nr:hypothetical protein [Candidatus Fokinia cryptica]WPX97884.1 BioH-like alpha-beta hydrolase family protein [Candidatus Fokinia cryptica]